MNMHDAEQDVESSDLRHQGFMRPASAGLARGHWPAWAQSWEAKHRWAGSWPTRREGGTTSLGRDRNTTLWFLFYSI
jgi:hypothetical protein